MSEPRVLPDRAVRPEPSGDTSLAGRYALALVIQVLVVAALVWLGRHFS